MTIGSEDIIATAFGGASASGGAPADGASATSDGAAASFRNPHEPDLPPRPAIPPTFYVMVAVIATESVLLRWDRIYAGEDGDSALVSALVVVGALAVIAGLVALACLGRAGRGDDPRASNDDVRRADQPGFARASRVSDPHEIPSSRADDSFLGAGRDGGQPSARIPPDQRAHAPHTAHASHAAHDSHAAHAPRAAHKAPIPAARTSRLACYLRAGLPLAAMVLSACAVAALVTLSYAAQGAAFDRALQTTKISDWSFEILSDANETRYGWRCRARARPDDRSLPSAEVWLSTSEPVTYGMSIRIIGSYKVNGQDDWGRSSRAQGVWGSVSAKSIKEQTKPPFPTSLVLDLRLSALKTLNPDSSDTRALLAGCVCGYRPSLRARSIDDLFSTCGVAHLIAVSGGHIAIVSALVAGFAERLDLRPYKRMTITLVVSGLFVLCCGAPASAVRSWLMSGVSQTARVAGRREHAPSAVCLVATGMALVNPGVTGQLGYLLSVTSVLALCLFSRYAYYVLDVLFPLRGFASGVARWAYVRNGPRRRAFGLGGEGSSSLRSRVPGLVADQAIGRAYGLRSAVGTAVLCQVATLPLTLGAYAQLSLVAPLANALVSIPFAAFVSLGAAAACLASGPVPVQVLVQPMLCACDLLGWLMLGMLRILARLPAAALPIDIGPLGQAVLAAATLTCAIVVLVVWPRVRRRAVMGACAIVAAAAVALVVHWRYLAPASIVVLDVGQGDAILVQDGAAALLVDTGPAGTIASAASRQHLLHLDAVLLTHLHDDHTGGVGDLVGLVGCDRVLVGEGVSEDMPSELGDSIERLCGRPTEELAYGDVISVGGWTLRMVWPREARSGTVNADSIELLASYDAGGRTLTALLTGDAERDETAEVVAAGDAGDIDVLKVGHHGSEVSIARSDAAALDPEVAVASAGEGNRYGHPTSTCVDVLEDAGAAFLCTIEAGDVTIEPGAEGPVVTCQRTPGHER